MSTRVGKNWNLFNWKSFCPFCAFLSQAFIVWNLNIVLFAFVLCIYFIFHSFNYFLWAHMSLETCTRSFLFSSISEQARGGIIVWTLSDVCKFSISAWKHYRTIFKRLFPTAQIYRHFVSLSSFFTLVEKYFCFIWIVLSIFHIPTIYWLKKTFNVLDTNLLFAMRPSGVKTNKFLFSINLQRNYSFFGALMVETKTVCSFQKLWRELLMLWKQLSFY